MFAPVVRTLHVRAVACTRRMRTPSLVDAVRFSSHSKVEEERAKEPVGGVAEAAAEGMAEGMAEGTTKEANGSATSDHGRHEHTLKRKMLEAALEAVPEHGWTVSALSAGAVACGLSPAAHGMAPRGPIELVRHFNEKCALYAIPKDDEAMYLREQSANKARL